MRRTTRHLDAVLDNAHDVILLVSDELKVVMANGACADLLGYAPDKVVEHPITEFLPSFEAGRRPGLARAGIARRRCGIRGRIP